MNRQKKTVRVAIDALVMLLTFIGLSLSPARALAESGQKLRIVGGLAAARQYIRHEEPFWSKELLRLSHGKFSAEIVPFDRAGVPGQDMLRLMQLGVVPLGTLQLNRIASQEPEFNAPDLAGLNPDMATLKKNVGAFRLYLEKTLRERYGIELLPALPPFPPAFPRLESDHRPANS